MSDKNITPKELHRLDPFLESVGKLLVVAFPKSTSKNFAFALSIAESASKFAVAEINGKAMHVAVFNFTPADAGKAKLLLSYANSWKGTLVFQGGNLLHSSYRVAGTIECYITSESCRDKRAHCNTIIDNYNLNERYLFPCKLISYYFRPMPEHPSSIQDQIHALAVEHSCNWCPNFNTDTFKELNNTKTEKEINIPHVQIQKM